jgi:energy-coupling factor transport system permease protein
VRPYAPLAPPDAPLARRNPVAALVAASVPGLALLVVVDPVTCGLLLGAELLAVPFTGVRLAPLARRSWPLLLGATGVALSNALLSDAGGPALIDWPVHVGVAGALGGLAIVLRMLAIAVPTVVVFAAVDPTALADSLIQQARVPARFAIGALAAFRLLPELSADWQTIALARRARGVDAGRNPFAAVGLFAGQVFALLVAAIRRGVRLAAAMEARGFDSGRPRTVARPQTVTGADWALVAGAFAVAAAATAVSVAAGTWEPLLS